MPKFGTRSKELLEELDVRLQDVLLQAIHFYDFSIISGYRGQAEQDRLYRDGFSKRLYPMSKHNSNPSLAVDIAPYPIDWANDERFYFLAGIMKAAAHQVGVKLRWGGDWDSDNDFDDQTFMDLGHYELEGLNE